MNILFIGKRFYTNRDAMNEQFGRIYQLPKHWADSGTTTQLWLLDYHSTQTSRRMDGALYIINTPIRRPSWFTTLTKLLFQAFSPHHPSVIVASGDCYIGIMAWLIARILRAKFVFDVYDKYDEFSGYRKPFGWDLFGFLLKHADRCWFASQRLMAQLGREKRGDRVIPNGLDTQHFKPLDIFEARQHLDLESQGLFVGYFGSMEPDRGIDDLIKAVNLLNASGLVIELVLAGRLHPNLKLDQPGVRYLGNLPYETIPWALAAVDVVAVPYRRSAFLDSASSVKFGEIMACARPLVATRSPNLMTNFPEQATLLDKYLVAPSNPIELAEAIAKQIKQRLIVEIPTGLDWGSIAEVALGNLLLEEQPQ